MDPDVEMILQQVTAFSETVSTLGSFVFRLILDPDTVLPVASVMFFGQQKHVEACVEQRGKTQLIHLTVTDEQPSALSNDATFTDG